MIELHAIQGPTGRLLATLLEEKGLFEGEPKGQVNYGYQPRSGRGGLPVLNAKAGTLNKLQELQLLAKNGVSTVPHSINPLELSPPLFGRKVHHTRGNDIVVVQCGRPNPAKRVSDFYTTILHKTHEYRVWVFRGTPIGTYEKLLTYPERLGLRGRSKDVWNWRNGYGYEFVHPKEAAKELKKLGCSAIEALDLDFGAVDIIEGTDKKFYVLEVNTAPGVEGRRQALVSLANHIETWVKEGFPERKHE
jgi:hypothetical protein